MTDVNLATVQGVLRHFELAASSIESPIPVYGLEGECESATPLEAAVLSKFRYRIKYPIVAEVDLRPDGRFHALREADLEYGPVQSLNDAIALATELGLMAGREVRALEILRLGLSALWLAGAEDNIFVRYGGELHPYVDPDFLQDVAKVSSAKKAAYQQPPHPLCQGPTGGNV